MNMPQDFVTELSRLHRRIVVAAATDVTSWTLGVWCVARHEWLAGSVSLSVTAVATNATIGIFRKAQRTIDAAERALA